MKYISFSLLTIILLFFASSVFAADVETTFPTDQTSGSFTLGVAPKTVTFNGGEVRVAGITSLYRSGSRAFMVRNETAQITFGTPAQELRFYIKAQSSGNSFVRLIDVDNNELLRIEANNQSWQQVHLVNNVGIHKIEFTNNLGDLSAMEDFEYTAISKGSNEPMPIDDPIPKVIEEGSVKVNLEVLAGGLVSPVYGTFSPGIDDFVFIIDQIGKLYSLNLVNNNLILVMDFSDSLIEVNPNFDERGLLGLAFHPDFSTNGLLYTYSSQPTNDLADFKVMEIADHDAVITQWSANIDNEMGIILNTDSAKEVIRIEQPQFNHNGGTIVFDKTGMLLISLGDGGSADDQGDDHSEIGNGQDTTNVLGSILRINPLLAGGYDIPSDNPFINDANILDEVFVFGLRNPYRIAVDGDKVYVADVGQNDIEEINHIMGGENLAWPLKEGKLAFHNNGDDDGFVYDVRDADLPDGLTDPVAQYDHDEGIAIIGGFVYQGEIEKLQGKYMFGDWLQPNTDTGRLFYLAQTDLVAEIPVISGLKGQKVLGFAQTLSGDVLVLSSLNGVPSGESGQIAKMIMVPNQAPQAIASINPASVNVGNTVTLSAVGSSDPDGDELIYIWTQTQGPNVTLLDSRAQTTSFVTPQVSEDTNLTFMLEVSDGHLTDTTVVSVMVNYIELVTPSEPVKSSSGGGGCLASLLVILFLAKFRKV